jgi:DNA-binding NarL/FixJ family response regulator
MSATIRPVSRSVLIVDDHPSFRASARALLEAAGFEVVGEVSDGTSAVEAIDDLGPDVVLLDVQLPDMSGFDVCAILEGRGAPPPDIVLVSSRDVSDYGDLVDLSCACGFVPKGELSGDVLIAVLP